MMKKFLEITVLLLLACLLTSACSPNPCDNKSNYFIRVDGKKYNLGIKCKVLCDDGYSIDFNTLAGGDSFGTVAINKKTNVTIGVEIINPTNTPLSIKDCIIHGYYIDAACNNTGHKIDTYGGITIHSDKNSIQKVFRELQPSQMGNTDKITGFAYGSTDSLKDTNHLFGTFEFFTNNPTDNNITGFLITLN